MQAIYDLYLMQNHGKIEASPLQRSTSVIQWCPLGLFSCRRASEDDEEEEVGKKNKEQQEDDSSSDDSDEDGEVAIQVNRFFAELDIDEGKQKKRLLEEGVRAPKRKGVLPPHLHSVMGNANLRLARGDTAGAIELSMEVIRQGRGWLTKIMCYLKLAHV